jgi:hypothetical protein
MKRGDEHAHAIETVDHHSVRRKREHPMTGIPALGATE